MKDVVTVNMLEARRYVTRGLQDDEHLRHAIVLDGIFQLLVEKPHLQPVLQVAAQVKNRICDVGSAEATISLSA